MPRSPIHPGEHLVEELGELGLSAADTARQLGVPVNRIIGASIEKPTLAASG